MADFSCYINIKNESSIDFIDGDYSKSYGKYKSTPKEKILSRENTEFRLADKSGPAGSTGDVSYKTTNNGTLKFEYDCPYGSGNNKLNYTNKKTGLEVLFYGDNSKKYLSSIPKGENGKVSKKGHPLSGIFIVRDPLSTGWDIISAFRKSKINKSINKLYKKNIIANTYKGIKVGVPEIIDQNDNSQDNIKIKIEMKGTIKKILEIDGEGIFTIKLNDLNNAIQRSKKSNNLYIDLEKNLISDINLDKMSITLLEKKLSTKEIKQYIIDIIQNILKNTKSIKVPLSFSLPKEKDNIVIEFTYHKNKEDKNKSFAAILIGFDGKKGSKKLSDDIIYDSSECNRSFVLSNDFIMNSVKSIIENTLGTSKNLLELNDEYPKEMYNKEEIKINDVDDVWLKIKRKDINCSFNDKGELVFNLTVKWWNVATLGAEGSTKVELTFNFSIKEGAILLHPSKDIDTSAPWWFWTNPILIALKSTVEGLINKYFIDPIFESLGDTVLSIPKFEAINIISPSYIRISGKEK